MMGIYFHPLFLIASVQYAACQELPNQLSNPTIQGPERVNLNDTETISCIATSGIRSITYSLYREKTLVQTKNVSTPNAANFSVSFDSESAAGAYKCKAESDDATQAKYSDMINIIVLAPVLGIMLNSIPDPPVLKVQSKLILSCFVKQGSNVTYQWYFNNQKILPSPSITINQSNLVIDHVNLDNAGSYQCEASNQFNMKIFRLISNSAEVTIKVPASNPEISAKITYVAKDQVFASISCLSHEGTLPIIYTLYRNTRLIGNYTAQIRREGELIVQVESTDKLGTFKCKAENGFVSKYSNGLVIDLTVELTSNPDPLIPGNQFTLNCNITYEYTGLYTWHFVHPGKNTTSKTNKNQLNGIAVDTGRYCCSVNGHFSNWIEVPGQGSSFQPVTIAVSLAAIILLILALGLICYCIAHKDG
ncbi:Fc receptor-like protein 5 isoform X2 [Carcharodon carcharias]|uniref:Fc receptor-like protein 5 isoform X2 n=1 Tax=Carcharodon carcharias TaxID=13397 RepID=UPI001B7E664A|nr:Fc receptor-like protein 5 isoform X2 [Carcharodon carcharias]